MIKDESSVTVLILTASGYMASQDFYYNMLQKLWNRVLSNVSIFSWSTVFNSSTWKILHLGSFSLFLSLLMILSMCIKLNAFTVKEQVQQTHFLDRTSDGPHGWCFCKWTVLIKLIQHLGSTPVTFLKVPGSRVYLKQFCLWSAAADITSV